MYRWYQILLTILKIDMFFFLGYSIQYLVLVLHAGDVEFPLTITALPLICLFLILAVYAVSFFFLYIYIFIYIILSKLITLKIKVRHESKPLVIIFFVGLAAGCAYFIFKIVRMYTPSEQDKYKYVMKFLTFFGKLKYIYNNSCFIF